MRLLPVIFIVLPTFFMLMSCMTAQAKVINVLIVDGQNNHGNWPKTTAMMTNILQTTGRFNVDVYRTLKTWKLGKYAKQYGVNDGKNYRDFPTPTTDDAFAPDFTQYDVVISNFGWKAAAWPKATQLAFEHYMKNGGGFVSVHAADNSFPNWVEYNKMIGLGGWGGRDEKSGPYVYFDTQGTEVKSFDKGKAGQHGKQHEFTVELRNLTHPIVKGLPLTWTHPKDELYGNLRGPAAQMTILATAFNDKSIGGTGKHEPVLMAVNYHKGRIFHTTLGHNDSVYQDKHFIQLLINGAEWVATGNVAANHLSGRE